MAPALERFPGWRQITTYCKDVPLALSREGAPHPGRCPGECAWEVVHSINTLTRTLSVWSPFSLQALRLDIQDEWLSRLAAYQREECLPWCWARGGWNWAREQREEVRWSSNGQTQSMDSMIPGSSYASTIANLFSSVRIPNSIGNPEKSFCETSHLMRNWLRKDLC